MNTYIDYYSLCMNCMEIIESPKGVLCNVNKPEEISTKKWPKLRDDQQLKVTLPEMHPLQCHAGRPKTRGPLRPPCCHVHIKRPLFSAKVTSKCTFLW